MDRFVVVKRGEPRHEHVRPAPRPTAFLVFVIGFSLGSMMAARAGGEDFAPRSLTEPERYAVAVVAEFLDRGAPAIADELSPDSPLQSLPPDARLDEIEARTGPPTGATWELRTVVPSLASHSAVFAIGYPSGIDEYLTMHLVEDDGSWRIHHLEILADPSTYVLAQPAKSASPEDTERPPGVSLPMTVIPAACVIGALFIIPRSRRIAAAMMIAGTAAQLAALTVQLRATAPAPVAEPVRVVAEEPRNLAPLVALRRALATGDRETFLRLMESIPGAASDPIAQLWKASIDLRDSRRDDVRAALAMFPKSTRTPLVEILRARLAFLDAREVDAVLGWERAIDLGPGQDGLWLEAADSMWILGFEDRARDYLRRLSRIGARDSGVYYALASLDDGTKAQEVAEQAFRVAWKLEPRERSELLTSPRFWTVLQRPGVQSLLHLGAVDEPLVTREDVDPRPIAMPLGATAFTCGRYLEIRVGGQTLVVPDGSDIAPLEAVQLDARQRRVRAEDESLAIFARTSEIARSAGALAQPLLRRRIESVANALARRNRWAEVAALTDSFHVANENVPADLFFLRATALRHVGREPEARVLLGDLAKSPRIRRKADVQTLLALGEMLASVDHFDLARRSFEQAYAKRALPYLDDRIRQILLDKRLESASRQTRTEHFDIRYFDNVSPARAQRIGEILEAEFRRLQRWIPVRDFQPTSVHILSWEEFRRTYTGSDHILGFYDGKLRLPLGGAPLIPEVIAILSHELAHAMISQATNDQAPHWFQEGLAQYIEFAQYRGNVYSNVSEDSILSLPLVESVLDGYPDLEMMRLSYQESYATIRYIESRYGRPAIQTLMREFKDGASTEDAIAAISGLEASDFEHDLRTWATEKAPAVWVATDEIRYSDVSEERAEPLAKASPRKPLITNRTTFGAKKTAEPRSTPPNANDAFKQWATQQTSKPEKDPARKPEKDPKKDPKKDEDGPHR